MTEGYYQMGSSTPSTPQTPVTPLPLLVTSRQIPAQIQASAPANKPNMLASCLSMDSCGLVHDEMFPNTCSHAPLPSVSLTRKVAAEFLGTFILIFIATAAVIVDEKTGGSLTIIGNSASAGLAILVVILSVGHISGAHVNPSLTIAFAALRHFPWIQVPAYIAAQIVGSICASFVLKGVFNPHLHGGVTVPHATTVQCFFVEFIISFNLMFVVTAVATDTRAVGELAGIAVGATVMMNILISGATTGGSMNPVRTLGPAIAANNYRGLWLYMVAPVLGALTGAGAYTLVKLKDENTSAPAGRSSRSFRR
ncbi:hypothetical protein KP509_38G047700 [Ceratopteris richardii]|uniref:Uncharacterized protein n=1 Tax=Ceratopteris richardii TaxID=49495 RepID=A0A8T2Q4I9_CERRI|nr:hypothetical protein KP509_38G047700 [Ceratopteris richardii]